MVIERFGIFLVKLDPTTGAEAAKTRPCVVVSPNGLNRAIATAIIAPMPTTRRGWPALPNAASPSAQAGSRSPSPPMPFRLHPSD